MTAGPDSGQGPAAASARRPGRALATYLVLVVAAALGAVATAWATTSLDGRDAIITGVLTLLALGYDVVARRIEKVRRLTSAGPYVNMNSVWMFGAAIAVPTAWSVLLVVVLQAYLEVQARLDGLRRPWYRSAFNASGFVISFYTAGVVYAAIAPSGPDAAALAGWRSLAVLAAVATALAVNTALVAAAIGLSTRGASWRGVLGGWSDNMLEVATLMLGALTGLVVLQEVWLCLLAVPATVMLQRSALVTQLQSAASEDSKTGLLNSAAWQHLAERELERTAARGRGAAVVLIDLDRFKRINDTYGHLTGDAVLRAVADTMTTLLRDRDLLSRFGGEEFVALLPDADAAEAVRVAERLRARIADVVVTQVGDPPQPVLTAGDPLDGEAFGDRDRQIRVTVSVGIASHPQHGSTVTELVANADLALYEAKHAGRNRVRMSSAGV